MELEVGDFEVALRAASDGDLIFLDPPYVTGHNNNGFIDYNEKLFSWADQERLAGLAAELHRARAHVLVTNAHHRALLDLYPRFNLDIITRHSTLAGASGRPPQDARGAALAAPSDGELGMGPSSQLDSVDPDLIQKNLLNPRRYFNEERLDLLRTSIQEVGILVPLIVYEAAPGTGLYVLMDGERRWRCSIDLGLPEVPVNVIESPDRLNNLLRMFNIHNVREDWPLISVALSLRSVIDESGEERREPACRDDWSHKVDDPPCEAHPDASGLRTGTHPKRGHLDRTKQVHREDLYLEIESAVSVIRNELPGIAEDYPRGRMIRQFAAKAEEDKLVAVTDFRYVGRLLKAGKNGFADPNVVEDSVRSLIEHVYLSPKDVFDEVAAAGYAQHAVDRRAEILTIELEKLVDTPLSSTLRERLSSWRGSSATCLGED